MGTGNLLVVLTLNGERGDATVLVRVSTQEAAEMMQDDELLEKVFIRRKINDQTTYYMAKDINWYFGKTTGGESCGGKVNFNIAEFYKEVDDEEVAKVQKAEIDKERSAGCETVRIDIEDEPENSFMRKVARLHEVFITTEIERPETEFEEL